MLNKEIIYEFFHSNRNCHIFIKIENIASSVALMVLLIWDIFNLSLSYTNNTANFATVDNAISDVMISQTNDTDFANQVIPFLFLFAFPVISTVVEVVRAAVFYFQKDSNEDNQSKKLSDKVGNV